MKRLAACALGFTLSACASQVDLHRLQINKITKSDEIYMIGPSTQLVVQRRDGRLCFGPAPDAAPEKDTSFTLALPLTVNTSDNESGSRVSEELPLGGRNPNVLITRDLLFHSCLIESQLNLSADELREFWKSTLDAIVKINGQSLDGASITTDEFLGTLPGGGQPSGEGDS